MTISIRSKAILLFIGLALAPLILTTWIIIRPTVLAAIQQARIQNLEGIGDRQAELITVWMHERLHDAAVTAAMLSMHPSELTDQFNHTKLLYYLDTVRKEYGYKTIFVCDKDGRIWLSSGGDLKGQDVSGSDYFQQALKGSTFITEVRPSEFPIENELGEKEPGVPTLLVSTPVKAKGEVAGVLVLRVDLMLLNKEVRRVKMGKTGETYLVNSDGYMLTESAFIPAIKAMGLIKKRSALELRLKDPQTGKLTKGVKHCLEGGSGFNPEGYADYRGVQVLGYWHWMPEFRWGLMSEIDVVEAYEVIYRLDHYL
ncbi:MAG: cache domain-containing protein, partial [Candidatus Brocadiales bacterium]|nr:cache domain-containing protein [Candidatus Brocadiales bacterium]